MPTLIQLLNSAWKSSHLVPGTMFAILFAFIIWFVYGPEFDRAISGTPPTKSMVTSAPDDLPSPHEPATDMMEFRREPVVTVVPTPTAPASLSIEDKMLEIDRDATVARIEKLASDTLQLDADLKVWNKTTADLAINDSGRRMASDPKVFRAVAELVKSEPVPAVDLAALKRRVRLLEDEALTLRQARLSNGIDGAFTTTKAIFEKLRQSLDVASLSLAGFEKQCQLSKPSTMTLADAITKDIEQRAAGESSRLAKDMEEADERRADQKRKDAEVKKQREFDDEQVRLKAAEAKRQLETELARDLPQVQHYLGRFTSHGYTQPDSSTHYKQVTHSGPVSLAAIEKAGALSNVVEGLDGAYPHFLHLMSSPTNDRAVQSPYPRFIGGTVPPESAATVRQGYTLLKKYQHLLVEKGYLAP